MNLCRTCGEDFGSVKAFDAHRVGRYQPLERRCLTIPEMLAKGFEKNKLGRWSLAKHLEHGRALSRGTR